MDSLKNAFGGGSDEGNKNEEGQKGEQGGSSSGGGFMDKLNSKAGGGKESEKDEDYLDKGVDMVQQYAMGGGDQSNESAVEQAKDEQISDFIREKYRSTAGSDLPVADKDKSYEK